jgi:Cu(I)/Ag(I) efflux system membrane protein CusA/SilA
MLKATIEFSLRNKFVVALATLALALGGLYALKTIPLDALPDLSDTQVIIYTEWQGQAPRTVQTKSPIPSR